MSGRQLQALHGTIPTVSSTSTRGRGKKKEVEPALARIAQESPVVSDVIPVAAEFLKYIACMKSILLDPDDAQNLPCSLVIWSKGNYFWDNFEILPRIASSVLAMLPSNGDVERTNSKAGNVVSPHRGRLKPEATSELVFLRGIYAEEERKLSYRERMAKGNFHKFITYMVKSC